MRFSIYYECHNFRSSTISNSSGEKPHEAHGGFEAAESDFVYETSCSTETKLFEMGKTVDTHELPLPVQERARETQPPVPTTVESLIRESHTCSSQAKMEEKNMSNSEIMS